MTAAKWAILRSDGLAVHIYSFQMRVDAVKNSLCLPGVMSATGNGYVLYMTFKRKTKLKPPELMTLNLAIFDFGISGMASKEPQKKKEKKTNKHSIKYVELITVLITQ